MGSNKWRMGGCGAFQTFEIFYFIKKIFFLNLKMLLICAYWLDFKKFLREGSAILEPSPQEE